MNSQFSICLALAATLAASASAQSLVRDIQQIPATSTGGSDPLGYLTAGNQVFFTARIAGAGHEPCVSDGTPVGTRQFLDLVPGQLDAGARALCAIAPGEVLYRLDLPGAGHQLLRTDGTPAGTQYLGTLGLQLTPAQFFTAEQLPNGRVVLSIRQSGATFAQAYATDLTVAGTVPIPGMAGFQGLHQDGNGSYGVSADGYLWRSDGTVAGSVRLTDGAYPPATPNHPSSVTHWNGRTWFFKTVGQGLDMWSSDGSAAGTRREFGVTGVAVTPYFQGPFDLGTRLGWLAFGVLWTSDGTQAGSQAVANMPCNSIAHPCLFQGRLYFAAVGGNFGAELWSSDGTAAGTSIVKDSVLGGGNSTPANLIVSGNRLYCTLQAGSQLRYAVVTGPNAQDMHEVVPPSGVSLHPANRVPFAQGLVLTGSDPVRGAEPWFLGDAQTLFPLADLHQGKRGILTVQATRQRDRLLFVADDGLNGREVWVSDGTLAGTGFVDATPGQQSTVGNSFGQVELGDRVAISILTGASSQGRVLVSDGTVGGTVSLPPNAPIWVSRFAVASRGEELFFVSDEVAYRSDGTPGGTVQYPWAPTGRPDQLFALSTRLVLGFRYGQMRGTDGQSFAILSVGETSAILGQVGDRVVFADLRGVVATDGTTAGTEVLLPQVTSVHATAVGRNRLVVASGNAVYETDGSAVGTRLLAVAHGGLRILALLPCATKTMLLGEDAAHGRELWVADPMLGTFQLVADLAPGVLSGVQSAQVCGDGDLVFCAGSDGTDGSEPYLADGTPTGMRRLVDVAVGSGSSNPTLLAVAGERVYFLADDGVTGRELWQAPLAVVEAASIQTVAAGCLGLHGKPVLSVTALPILGSSSFGYELANARSSALVATVIGTELGDVPFGGCRIAPSGITVSRLAVSSVGGVASFALPIPASPAFVGVQLTAQGFVFDAAAAAGFAGSNGLLAVVGR